MRKLILLSIFLSTIMASARQLTVSDAIARFQNNGMVRMKAKAKTPSASPLTLAHTQKDGDMALMYVMNRADGKGFVVLGADDCAPVLIGYADNGSFDASNVPANFTAWMEGYAKSIAANIRNGQTMPTAIVSHAAIEPLVTTEWDQLYPYNKMCNDRGDSFGVYTGCVATAMAQVMNYHQYPERGIGEHSYSFKSGTATYTGSSNFAEHTYDWANMKNTYASSGNGNDAETAVATLMHDCGVAVDMRYNTTSSSEGSGASHNLVAQALINYFDYDRGVRTVTRRYFSDEQWETMMLAELEAGRPVIYAGASTRQGGHEFVMDGYDGNGRYHFNWGWSGSCNGFFLMTGTNAINPYTGNDNYGSWGDDPAYAFNIEQAATIGIQPDKGTKDVYEGMGMPGTYSLSMSECSYRGYYQYVNGYLWNIGVMPLTVTMGVKYVNVNDPNEVYYDASPTNMTRDVTSYALSYYVYLQNIINPGKYYVYPVYKDANDPHAEWQDVQLDYGYTDIPTFEWKASQPDITITDVPTLLSNGTECPDYQITKNNAKVKFSLKANVSVNREFLFELYNSSNTKVASFDGVFINQNADETNQYVVSLDDILATKNPGEYYLKIRTWSDSTVYPKYNSFVYFTLRADGDVNGDGEVTVADLTTLIQMLHTPSSPYSSPADITHDGQITISDVTPLADKIIGAE